MEEWRHDYNHVRPHSSLNYLTPMKFVDRKEGHQTNMQPSQDAVCARLLTVAQPHAAIRHF
ncbi:MAG: transposase [Alphaproteobacteria bacterium]|nr:transposase [Alphaproteobacteria bacterium]